MKGTARSASPAIGVVLDLARSAADEGEARVWADDTAFLAWAEGGGGASVVAAELKVHFSQQDVKLHRLRLLKSDLRSYCHKFKAHCNPCFMSWLH